MENRQTIRYITDVSVNNINIIVSLKTTSAPKSVLLALGAITSSAQYFYC